MQLDAKVNNFLKGWGEGSADLEAKLQRKREEEARLQAQRREKLERERRKARDDINAWSQVYQVRPARARERDASAHLLTAARERERAGGLLVLVELGHGRGDHDVSRREAAESEGAQAAGAEAARRCQRRRSRDGRACLSQPRIRGASIRQRARARAPRVRAWWLANYHGRVSLQSAMCPSRRIWYACSKISTKEKSQDGQSQRCADRIDRSGHVGGLARTTSFSAATHLDVARDFCNVAQ